MRSKNLWVTSQVF